MNEIEKLYSIVNIQKIELDYPDNIEPFYPEFTSAKQFDIIKLLCEQCDLTMSYFGKWEMIYFDGQDPIQVEDKKFEECLAKLVNSYWQNLTEKEQKQIKEILK